MTAHVPAAIDAFEPYLLGAAWLVVRVGALSMALPGFGPVGLPARARVLVVLMLSVAVDLAAGGVAVAAPTSALDVLAGLAREVLVGAGMGLAVRTVLAAVEGAGTVSTFSMALGLNMQVDPSTGDQRTSLTAVLGLVGAMIFVALGGHHLVFRVLVLQVRHLPPGSGGWLAPGPTEVAQAGAAVIGGGLLLAAPVVASTLLVNAALAFVARINPSVNLFAVGIGLLIVVGLVALAWSGGSIAQWIERGIDALPDLLGRWSGLPAG